MGNKWGCRLSTGSLDGGMGCRSLGMLHVLDPGAPALVRRVWSVVRRDIPRERALLSLLVLPSVWVWVVMDRMVRGVCVVMDVMDDDRWFKIGLCNAGDKCLIVRQWTCKAWGFPMREAAARANIVVGLNAGGMFGLLGLQDYVSDIVLTHVPCRILVFIR